MPEPTQPVDNTPYPDETPQEVQARLAAIVATSDDAIVSKDLNGVVRTWNAAAERIFGWTAAEMIGRPILTILPKDRQDEETHILSRIRSGQRVDHFETVRVRKDGRLIDVSVTISPIKDASGTIVGASKIARDITDLKRVLAERERLLASEKSARAEAERASRMKDEFLATLSHELRTPLNAILGWSQLLRTANLSPADVSQGLDTIARSARAQAQLIDDLLDMSRIISGRLRLDVQRVQLADVVEEAINSVLPAADAKQIRLLRMLDPKAGPINGDPARLQQVVWNLLTNAVKFTPKGGRIQVFLQRVNSHVEITVTDSGQGIAAEAMPHLFERFWQADASSTRHHGGLGLGLAIVRHLTELHGGTVRASSPGPGQGSTFTIELPVAAIHDLLAHPDGAHPTAEPPPPPPDTANSAPSFKVDLAGVKVLCVDDEPDACMLVKRALELNGATVVTAASAAEGLELLRRERPAVLLTDIGMPGQDGFHLIAQVRELPPEQGGSTPAVALTAFARSEDRRRALIAGFQMHLPKPVEPAELIAVVASLAGVARRPARMMN